MVLSNDLKKAICFGLIFGCIISLLQLVCFCAEVEDVDIERIDGVAINSSGNFFIAGTSTGYFELEHGYIYHINYIGGGILYLATSNDVPKVNDTYNFLTSMQGPFEYDYISVGDSFMYFDFTQATTSITVTREPLTGMNGFVDNIAYSLSIANLSSVWVLVVPIIAICVLFGLGFYLLKRLLNKIKRAKGGA